MPVTTDVILDDQRLRDAGFVLQGVLSTKGIALPKSLNTYEQLLVFAHGGRGFWSAKPNSPETDDPLDQYSIQLADELMLRLGIADYGLVYPSNQHLVSLIDIGKRLGWHHDTPMGVGINATYGTWFAYRVVVAANTSFALTVQQTDSPCEQCADKPCVDACPVGAVKVSGFDLETCSHERLREGSPCSHQCLARLVCPVGAAHRYEESQVRYHYGRSLVALRAYAND